MSTYSAQGDQWTIDNENDETNAVVGSSVQDLTKDLMEQDETAAAATGMDKLDFDMSDDEKPPVESPSDDESVDMKDANNDNNDDDDNTVGLSADEDDDDRTVAFEADDDDDRTVAQSVANQSTLDDHKDASVAIAAATDMLQDKTIDVYVPTQDKDVDHDELNVEEQKETAESANSEKGNDDDDDDEMEFEMSNTESNEAFNKTEKESKNAAKSAEKQDVAESDDDEMEFDMTSADIEPDEESGSNEHEQDEEEEKEFDMNSEDTKADEHEASNSERDDENSHSQKDQMENDASNDTAKDGNSPSNSTTPRRSVRARKSRALYSEEQHESVLAKAKRKSPPKPKSKKSKSKKSPTEDDWIDATDHLYVHTEDKSAVTVKEFIVALEEKFDCKITKPLKKAVRNRLKAIVNGNVVPSAAAAAAASDDSDDDDLQEETNNNNEEQEPQEPQSDESEEEADDEASDYEDEPEQPKRRKNRSAASRRTTVRRPLRNHKHKNTSTARAAKKVVEAHRLRQQKRAEDLKRKQKVRNEEMQIQSKEDEERQEAIAQKFETNTDELRLKRLEDRLDLLQKLDETRISVVTTTTTTTTTKTTKLNPQQTKRSKEADDESKPDDANTAAAQNDNVHDAMDHEADRNSDSSSSSGSEEESSSSDEEELDIVGMKKMRKPLKLLHNHLPSRGLQLLDEIGSPKKASRKQLQLLKSKSKSKDGNTSTMLLSPNKSMGARFALLNALKQKQVRQGNRWLARELGYKTEEDHLKDCQNVADKKRGLMVQQEQERLKANERKQLRERLILQEQQGFPQDDSNPEDDDDDEAYVPPPEEEDEEMQMAKEIEQEAKEHEMEIAQGNGVQEERQFEELQEVELLVGELQAADEIEQHKLGGSPMENEMETTQPPVSNENKTDTVSETKTLAPAVKELSENVEKTLENDKPPSVDGDTDITPSTEEPSTTEEEVNTTIVGKTSTLDESVVTPEKNDARSDDDEGELEFDATNEEKEPAKDPNRPRNAGWKAMLEREAEKLKKRKKRKGGLVEEEAEEEEEEEIAGLEDFGFLISKKKKNGDDDEDNDDDKLDEEDLKHVVDDVSDGEGDEDAGHAARKRLEQDEEKARHKEILRRMREGYDGRRGGIAGGGAGARGMHRFDQLVAADNREDAKRLGLLNDDEMDSDDENGGKQAADEEEDETALLDKMLKDRFLHRSSVELEENFSEDEEEEEDETEENSREANEDDEVKTQERLAKRFAKRARMQRLEELYGDSQEFSQQRLIDEDASMKEELSKMRCGLLRRSSSLSRASSLSRSSSTSSSRTFGRQTSTDSRSGMFQKTSGSLSIALRANKKRRTSFLGGSNALNGNLTAGATKALSLGPYSQSGFSNQRRMGKTAKSSSDSGSLFAKVTK